MITYELKLVDKNPSAKAIKVLRRFFPNKSIAELQQKIINGDSVFSCYSGSTTDDKIMLQMVTSLQKENLKIELYTKACDKNGCKIYPMCIADLQASIRLGREIKKQVIEDINNEADE